MRYRITHRTSYRHSEMVPLCQNALWLTPRSNHRQQRESFQLDINPSPATRGDRVDYFGNDVTHFTIDSGYRALDILAVSEVHLFPQEEAPRSIDAPAWDEISNSLCRELTVDGIEVCQFRFASPCVEHSDEIAEYAQTSFPPGRPLIEAVFELSGRIHRDFRYEPGATNVHTAVAEAFEKRRGVCQDFAHIAIACLRSQGLSARYVSGYLRTLPPPGQPRLTGADASHAWFSVYGGHAGWIDFDPTNDAIPSTDHVTLAWGRDYGDVTPVRGLFVGGGRHEMEVSVDVAPIGDQRDDRKADR